MDYQAEQEMEVEALESILMDDFEGTAAFVSSLFDSGNACRNRPQQLRTKFVASYRTSRTNPGLLTEVQGPSPSGWSDSAKCYRIGLPTGNEDSEPKTGASKSVLIQRTSCKDIAFLHFCVDISLLHAVQFDIIFAHTATYPDEAPLVKISK